MQSSQIQENIIEFLKNDIGVDAGSISPDDQLFSSGLLNSLDILELVSFIESKFDVKISTWEISLEKFDTIQKITEFIEERAK